MDIDNRGAFGSNQPLERIPYQPPDTAGPVEIEKLEVLESAAAPPVPEKLRTFKKNTGVSSSVEDEPVYLREELRPRSN